MFRHTYRFISSSGTPTGITPNSLLGCAGNIGTVVNSLVAAIAGAVKLERLTIWAPPASQGATATVSVDWAGLANSPNVEVSDTTVSVSRPAFISTSPPRQSLAAFWQVASTTTLCTITAPEGSIIDAQLSLILTDNDVNGVSTSVATAAVGGSYFLSLDPNATHRYVPVSLTTTT